MLRCLRRGPARRLRRPVAASGCLDGGWTRRLGPSGRVACPGSCGAVLQHAGRGVKLRQFGIVVPTHLLVPRIADVLKDCPDPVNLFVQRLDAALLRFVGDFSCDPAKGTHSETHSLCHLRIPGRSGTKAVCKNGSMQVVIGRHRLRPGAIQKRERWSLGAHHGGPEMLREGLRLGPRVRVALP